MVVNFSKLNGVISDLIGEYRDNLIRYGEYTGKCTYLGDDENHPAWFQQLFDVLDEELDHREEVICDTVEGKVNYLGQTGLPLLLNIRQYIAVIRAKTGSIVIDYTTGGIKDSSVRSASIVVGNSLYLIRNDRDTIMDYPFEQLA